MTKTTGFIPKTFQDVFIAMSEFGIVVGWEPIFQEPRVQDFKNPVDPCLQSVIVEFSCEEEVSKILGLSPLKWAGYSLR